MRTAKVDSASNFQGFSCQIQRHVLKSGDSPAGLFRLLASRSWTCNQIQPESINLRQKPASTSWGRCNCGIQRTILVRVLIIDMNRHNKCIPTTWLGGFGLGGLKLNTAKHTRCPSAVHRKKVRVVLSC